MNRAVPNRLTVTLAAAAVACTVAGCGAAPSAGVHHASGAAAVPVAFAAIRSHAELADTTSIVKTLADYLPNQLFSINGNPAAPVVAGVVEGTVTSVEPAGAWQITSDAGDPGKQVAWDSADADWRTIKFTVSVDQAWGEFPNQVTAELSIQGDKDYVSVMNGIKSMGTAVLALDRLGSYELTPDAYPVAMNGAGFGQVDGGTITFSAMQGADAATFVGNTKTVKDLKSAAAQEKPIIKVRGFARQ
jgi:hypothetical protein